jgi:transcription antitermination protein NusB
VTVPEDRPDATRRRAARLAAIQALYQMEITGEAAGYVADEFVAFRFGCEPEITALGPPDEEFFAAILAGVPRQQDEIDAAINGALSEKWRLSRVDSILRAILRAGVFELIGRKDVPAKAVIDEYVELAHAFATEEEAGFVNAALDAIARQKRASEFGLPPPEGELEF